MFRRLWRRSSEWHTRGGATHHDDPPIVVEDTSEAQAAAAGAAVAHVLSRPDSIRLRAQNAATISSAVAAGLVVSAVSRLSGGSEEHWLTTGLVLAAVVAWVISVILYVRVVTVGAADQQKKHKVNELLNSYRAHSEKLRARLRSAALWSAAALSLTVCAVLVPALELESTRTKEVTLTLTGSGARALGAACKRTPPRRFRAYLEIDDITKPIVSLTPLSNERCTTAQKIHLRRSRIVAISETK